MEPAKIDWKKVESVFVEDSLYENIHAPKWVDFLAPDDDSVYSDDTTWFCRPDCNHPKTVEDFLKITTPTNSKISSSGGKTKTPLGEWSLRDVKLKRRGQVQSTLNSDVENKNPNLSTPPFHHGKSMKAMIKSSTEKKKPIGDDMPPINGTSRLKSTLSAKNLFAGKDILGHIAEFCNELKRMAIGTKERENIGKLDGNGIQVEEAKHEVVDNDDVNQKERKPLLEVGTEKYEEVEKRSVNNGIQVEETKHEVVDNDDVNQKERKPLLEVDIEKHEEIEKRSVKKMQTRKIRHDNEENIPFSLNLENVKSKGEDQQRLLQIRTNPPSPQCFSANRALAKNTTPSKASKSRLMVQQQERGILQEVKQNREDGSNEEKGKSYSIVDGRGEARTLDVFWFFKPCSTTTST